ncbi:MAG: helix-turn-helix transcriptional regulator [Lachnospiraceae bacterium]|nr:helix-turn-helix transcriptional regulator [Lachnospiraceae bacterium]
MRLAHGYKQADIAGAIDIKQATYSNYENGKRTPGTMVLYRLANFYGMSVDDLMKLSIHLDENIYYDAPGPTQVVMEEADFLSYHGDRNEKPLSEKESRLLFHFSKLSPAQQDEVISFAKFKRKEKGKY